MDRWMDRKIEAKKKSGGGRKQLNKVGKTFGCIGPAVIKDKRALKVI